MASKWNPNGLLVYTDQTGVYTEEAELLINPNADAEGKWHLYRFVLERYTPETLEQEWFANDLAAIALNAGRTREDLAQDLCSDSASLRGAAYQAIGSYHLDSYPQTFGSRLELPARIREVIVAKVRAIYRDAKVVRSQSGKTWEIVSEANPEYRGPAAKTRYGAWRAAAKRVRAARLTRVPK